MTRITRASTGFVRTATAVAVVTVVVAVAPSAPVEASDRATDDDVRAAHDEWEAAVPRVRSAARALEAAEGELDAARRQAAAAEGQLDGALARVNSARATLDELQSRQVQTLAEAHLAQVQQQAAASALEGAETADRSRSGAFGLAGPVGDGGLREEARIRSLHGRAQLDAVAAWSEEATAAYEELRAELTGVTEQRNGAGLELEGAERAHVEAVGELAVAAAAVAPVAEAAAKRRDELAARQAEHDEALEHLRGLGWRAGVLGRGGLVWPTDGSPGSRFGPRRHPISGRVRLHAGLDVPAPTGQNVVATRAGKVTFADANGGYGFMVDIDHGDRRLSRYAHLSYIHVRPGDHVEQAERIGRVGSTGASTGPHLHFEYLIDGQPQDPLRWFAGVIGG